MYKNWTTLTHINKKLLINIAQLHLKGDFSYQKDFIHFIIFNCFVIFA